MIKINPILCITAFIAVLSNFSIDFFVPSLPYIATDLHSTYVQLAISFYLIGAGLGQLIYGPLSDYYGRKKILLFGITLSLIGTLFCRYAPTALFFFFGRFIQGLGLASCLTMTRSILTDYYDTKNISKMYSIIGICTEGTTLLAPLIGAYIQFYYDWRMNFQFFALLSLISLFVIYWFLPETNKHIGQLLSCRDSIAASKVYFGSRDQAAGRMRIHMYYIHKYFTILKDIHFIIFTLCSTFAASGFYIYASISPFLYEERMGLSVIQYSYTAFLMGGIFVTGCIFNSMLLHKRNNTEIIHIGGKLMFFSGIVLLISLALGKEDLIAVLISSCLYMFGTALVFPNALAKALSDYQNTIGTATSLYGTCQLVGSFCFTYIIAHTNIHSPIPIALSYLLLGAITLISLTHLKRKSLMDQNFVKI